MTVSGDASLTTDVTAHHITATQAADLLRDLYGLEAICSSLSSERDQNFLAHTPDGDFLLKLANPLEDWKITDFQSKALLHIARVDPTLPTPRLLLTRDGEYNFLFDRPGHPAMVVRLLTFLQGVSLHRVPRSAAQRRHLGAILARLDMALAGFSHPAADHPLLWDIKRALAVREFLDAIADPECRALAGAFLSSFEHNALPELANLRQQVTHNDMNPHNILVASDNPNVISGIIDFGDMIQAPLIDDLATAAAYQLTEEGHPLAGVAEMAAAYHAVLPLEEREIALLYDLLATRMVLTVTITAWRAARFPENRDYILRNAPRAWAGLARLAALPRAAAQDYLSQACLG